MKTRAEGHSQDPNKSRLAKLDLGQTIKVDNNLLQQVASRDVKRKNTSLDISSTLPDRNSAESNYKSLTRKANSGKTAHRAVTKGTWGKSSPKEAYEAKQAIIDLENKQSRNVPTKVYPRRRSQQSSDSSSEAQRQNIFLTINDDFSKSEILMQSDIGKMSTRTKGKCTLKSRDIISGSDSEHNLGRRNRRRPRSTSKVLDSDSQKSEKSKTESKVTSGDEIYDDSDYMKNLQSRLSLGKENRRKRWEEKEKARREAEVQMLASGTGSENDQHSTPVSRKINSKPSRQSSGAQRKRKKKQPIAIDDSRGETSSDDEVRGIISDSDHQPKLAIVPPRRVSTDSSSDEERPMLVGATKKTYTIEWGTNPRRKCLSPRSLAVIDRPDVPFNAALEELRRMKRTSPYGSPARSPRASPRAGSPFSSQGSYRGASIPSSDSELSDIELIVETEKTAEKQKTYIHKPTENLIPVSTVEKSAPPKFFKSRAKTTTSNVLPKSSNIKKNASPKLPEVPATVPASQLQFVDTLCTSESELEEEVVVSPLPLPSHPIRTGDRPVSPAQARPKPKPTSIRKPFDPDKVVISVIGPCDDELISSVKDKPDLPIPRLSNIGRKVELNKPVPVKKPIKQQEKVTTMKRSHREETQTLSVQNKRTLVPRIDTFQSKTGLTQSRKVETQKPPANTPVQQKSNATKPKVAQHQRISRMEQENCPTQFLRPSVPALPKAALASLKTGQQAAKSESKPSVLKGRDVSPAAKSGSEATVVKERNVNKISAVKRDTEITTLQNVTKKKKSVPTPKEGSQPTRQTRRNLPEAESVVQEIQVHEQLKTVEKVYEVPSEIQKHSKLVVNSEKPVQESSEGLNSKSLPSAEQPVSVAEASSEVQDCALQKGDNHSNVSKLDKPNKLPPSNNVREPDSSLVLTIGEKVKLGRSRLKQTARKSLSPAPKIVYKAKNASKEGKDTVMDQTETVTATPKSGDKDIATATIKMKEVLKNTLSAYKEKRGGINGKPTKEDTSELPNGNDSSAEPKVASSKKPPEDSSKSPKDQEEILLSDTESHMMDHTGCDDLLVDLSSIQSFDTGKNQTKKKAVKELEEPPVITIYVPLKQAAATVKQGVLKNSKFWPGSSRRMVKENLEMSESSCSSGESDYPAPPPRQQKVPKDLNSAAKGRTPRKTKSAWKKNKSAEGEKNAQSTSVGDDKLNEQIEGTKDLNKHAVAIVAKDSIQHQPRKKEAKFSQQNSDNDSTGPVRTLRREIHTPARYKESGMPDLGSIRIHFPERRRSDISMSPPRKLSPVRPKLNAHKRSSVSPSQNESSPQSRVHTRGSTIESEDKPQASQTKQPKREENVTVEELPLFGKREYKISSKLKSQPLKKRLVLPSPPVNTDATEDIPDTEGVYGDSVDQESNNDAADSNDDAVVAVVEYHASEDDLEGGNYRLLEKGSVVNTSSCTETDNRDVENISSSVERVKFQVQGHPQGESIGLHRKTMSEENISVVKSVLKEGGKFQGRGIKSTPETTDESNDIIEIVHESAADVGGKITPEVLPTGESPGAPASPCHQSISSADDVIWFKTNAPLQYFSGVSTKKLQGNQEEAERVWRNENNVKMLKKDCSNYNLKKIGKEQLNLKFFTEFDIDQYRQHIKKRPFKDIGSTSSEKVSDNLTSDDEQEKKDNDEGESESEEEVVLHEIEIAKNSAGISRILKIKERKRKIRRRKSCLGEPEDVTVKNNAEADKESEIARSDSFETYDTVFSEKSDSVRDADAIIAVPESDDDEPNREEETAENIEEPTEEEETMENIVRPTDEEKIVQRRGSSTVHTIEAEVHVTTIHDSEDDEEELLEAKEGEDDNEDVPETESDHENVPEVENNEQDVSDSKNDQENVPEIENDKQDISDSENDQENVPEVENDKQDDQENAPEIENGKQGVPVSDNDEEKLPEIEGEKEDLQETENDNDGVPESENVPDTSDHEEELDAAEKARKALVEEISKTTLEIQAQAEAAEEAKEREDPLVESKVEGMNEEQEDRSEDGPKISQSEDTEKKTSAVQDEIENNTEDKDTSDKAAAILKGSSSNKLPSSHSSSQQGSRAPSRRSSFECREDKGGDMSEVDFSMLDNPFDTDTEPGLQV